MLSPDDETFATFAFYAAHGVDALLDVPMSPLEAQVDWPREAT